MSRTADAIEEGLSIASAAARLAVRNHILVEAISNDVTYDVDMLARFAHDVLMNLATEQKEAAELVRNQRRAAWGKYTDSHGTHDYRDRDTRNLRRRERQYKGVAKVLRRRADDPDAVRELVNEARDAAWGDVESNLQRRLFVEAMRPEYDPDYASMRDARMQALRLVDLPRLRAHRRRLAQAVTEPESD